MCVWFMAYDSDSYFDIDQDGRVLDCSLNVIAY